MIFSGLVWVVGVGGNECVSGFSFVGVEEHFACLGLVETIAGCAK